MCAHEEKYVSQKRNVDKQSRETPRAEDLPMEKDPRAPSDTAS